MSARKAPSGLFPVAMAPGAMPPASGRHVRRQDGWLGRRLVRSFAFLVVFVTMGITFLTTQEDTAAAVDLLPGESPACYVTTDFFGRGPETPKEGPEVLFAPGPGSADDLATYKTKLGITDWNDKGTYTQYESTGVRGARWTTTEWYQQDEFEEWNGLDEDPKRCDVSAEVMTMTAQMIFDLDRMLTSAVIALRQTATDATPFINMLRDMSPQISTMRDKLFYPGVAIAIMATGLWVMTRGRNRQREVISGIGGAFVFALLAGFLLSPSPISDGSRIAGQANYLWLAETSNSWTHKFNSEIAAALLPQVSTDGPCALNAGVPDRGYRMLDCSIYETLVFDPWTQGQFGALGYHQAIPYKDLPNKWHDDELGPEGLDVRLAQINAQSVSYAEQYGDQKWRTGGASEKEHNPDTKYGQWNLIRQEMFERQHPSYNFWKGEEASARVAAAFSGLLASILVGVFVAATSLITMVWNAVPVILMLALPIVGLVSIFPPCRKFLLGLGQTWIKAQILGVVLGIAQILSLIAVSGVLQSDEALGWKCLLMIVMVMGLWKVVKSAREDAFTPNLGGDAKTFDADTLGREAVQQARGAKTTARRAVNSKSSRVLSTAVVNTALNRGRGRGGLGDEQSNGDKAQAKADQRKGAPTSASPEAVLSGSTAGALNASRRRSPANQVSGTPTRGRVDGSEPPEAPTLSKPRRGGPKPSTPTRGRVDKTDRPKTDRPIG